MANLAVDYERAEIRQAFAALINGKLPQGWL